MSSAIPTLSKEHDLSYAAYRLRQVQRKVLCFMASDVAPHSAAYIAQNTELTRKAVAHALTSLANHEFIQPVLPKRWALTTDGRNVAKILRSFQLPEVT